MSIEIRTIHDSEISDWLRAIFTGFLRPPVVSEEEVAARRPGMDLDRVQGAFDRGRCVGTFRSFEQRLTVPGGARVAADAISGVTVSPTHRRRGLLSRMMARDLAAAKERGDVVATLIAAEYPIYGRFGFGPSAWGTEWQVETARAGLDPRWAGPDDGGRVDLGDGADYRALGPELHERLAGERAGLVSRDKRWWQRASGELRFPVEEWKEPYYIFHRSPEGRVDGVAAYSADGHWEAKQPQGTITVRELLAATPEAERALWHFLFSVDWVLSVRTGHRAPDDVLPLLLPDPRAARVVSHADLLWTRLLDVPRALEARTYPVSGSLVIEVQDPAGLAGGRYRLDASPEGASCAPTTASADLSLSMGDLSALYLGDESPVRLLALGRVVEHRTGAAALADALLRTPRKPWCPDIF
ncbi:GNAT family N-acetyltransferase [Streptomyces sp. URMC 123]|uniref:GNAT family N-acetyltransferase n=1 Tax=Streptomyces sp. URMC 123 TaxID=3423403 RepID=UPI003F1D4995